MPEGVEVEYARRLIEERALGRKIAGIDAPDAWYLKRGLTAGALELALTGHRLTAARRRGKLLLLDTDRAGPTLGLHLGMSGRVLVDDHAAGDPLIYGSNLENPIWHRFTLCFDDGGSLAMRDPRRLGAVELDPDEERLGPDAFDVTRAVRETKAGKIEYRVDKAGNVHAAIGKVSFAPEALEQNFKAFMEQIVRAKPATSKGVYIRNVAISSSMGPGVSIDITAYRSTGTER